MHAKIRINFYTIDSNAIPDDKNRPPREQNHATGAIGKPFLNQDPAPT